MLALTCLSPLVCGCTPSRLCWARKSSNRCSRTPVKSDLNAVSPQHRDIWHATLKIPSQRQSRLVARVAKPRHDESKPAPNADDSQWDKASAETEAGVSDAAPSINWPKLQSIAAISGGSILALTLTVAVLLPTNEVPGIVYKTLPEVVQNMLPDKPELGLRVNKSPGQFDLGALVQNAAEQGARQKDAVTDQLNASQIDRQKQVEKNRAERQTQNDKVKREVQEKQDKRQKDLAKAKEKQKEEAEKREKERKEKERKEQEKRKKFREQALVGGSIFGVSALTFGKWQLVASLGAVVFRTVGGPTILSSILRTPGYIIGRSVRLVEWNVSDSPARPDGEVVSFTLRALTPDGLRMAIAKQHGLSNYREVRQVSHWITSTTPCFFEPLRTPTAFKMLPDPAFVVWSRHPPKGRNKLPTRGEQSVDDSPTTFLLRDFSADQATALMLQVISGVAASSRLQQESHRVCAESPSNGSSGMSASLVSSCKTNTRLETQRQAMGAGNSKGQSSSAHRSASRSSSDSTQAASANSSDAHAQPVNSMQADRSAGPHSKHSQLDPSAPEQQKKQPSDGGDRSHNSNTEGTSSGRRGKGRHGQAEDSVAKQHENAQQDDTVPSHRASLHQQKEASASAQSWSDPSVLQYLHENSAMASIDLGKQLQLPEGFECVDQAEEDRLVLAGCQSTEMLCLFRAYAAHDALTFIKFARLCHSKVQM